MKLRSGIGLAVLTFGLACGSMNVARGADDPAKDGGTLVVAADGSGQYKTVQEAVDAAPSKSKKWTTIQIKPGRYEQVVTVAKDKTMIRFLGTKRGETVLTFSNSAKTLGENGKPLGTRKSASVYLMASDFEAKDITFENSAGPVGQAVAVFISGDRNAFKDCRFVGWQDTVFAQAGRQYYQDCYISGHVDFIFGGAVAYFKNCELHCRRGGSITAASTDVKLPYGYVFVDCKITADAPPASVVLGRPWRANAGTVFINTSMPAAITPTGWDNWGNKENETTARYAEFNSTGPGAHVGKRFPWIKQLSADEAAGLTPEKILSNKTGDWTPFEEDAKADLKK